MSFEFCNIKFQRLILHTVYVPDNNGIVKPFISSLLSNLDTDGKAKLQERITTVLGSGSHCLEMNVENKSENSCIDIVCDLINSKDDNSFILKSGKLANLHTTIHTNKKWPGGSLVVIDCTVGVQNKRAVIIIKAERQEGFLEEEKGQQIEMKYVENLLLTPQTKLYKVGAYIFNDKSGTVDVNSDVLSFVFDSNISEKDDRKAARYFYSNFLGLSVPENSEQLTRNFFELTSDFINKCDLGRSEKLDLHNALYTYLKTDKKSTIEVSTFSENYLTDDLSDDFENFMKSKKFPMKSVVKDNTLIKNKLKLRKLNFSSNVKIIAPADEFSKLIEIVEITESFTTIKVSGAIMDDA